MRYAHPTTNQQELLRRWHERRGEYYTEQIQRVHHATRHLEIMFTLGEWEVLLGDLAMWKQLSWSAAIGLVARYVHGREGIFAAMEMLGPVDLGVLLPVESGLLTVDQERAARVLAFLRSPETAPLPPLEELADERLRGRLTG